MFNLIYSFIFIFQVFNIIQYINLFFFNTSEAALNQNKKTINNLHRVIVKHNNIGFHEEELLKDIRTTVKNSPTALLLEARLYRLADRYVDVYKEEQFCISEAEIDEIRMDYEREEMEQRRRESWYYEYE